MWTRCLKINWVTGGALDLRTWFFLFGSNLTCTCNTIRCSSNTPNSSFKWAHLSSRSAANCGSLKGNRETGKSRLMVIMNRGGKAAAVACGQDYNTEKSQQGNEDVRCSTVGSLCECECVWMCFCVSLCLPECVQSIYDITHEERQRQHSGKKKNHNAQS